MEEEIGAKKHFDHLHRHPLILKVVGMKDHCRACLLTILPWELAYECGDCEEDYYYLAHKRCGEAPREMINHPKHHHHALILVDPEPFTSNQMLSCNECGEHISRFSFSYRCYLCKFYLHISCAVWAWETEKEIHHFSHLQHPLILKRGSKESDETSTCRGCHEFIDKLQIAYRCGECEDYNLHKICAELPREIMHPRHYKHPLILQSSSSFRCNGCLEYWFSFKYYCSLCEFALEPACALKENYIVCPSEENRYIWRHKGHDPPDQQQHSHSLMLHPRQALFLCHACGSEKKDQVYTCSSCPFMIHKTCASLPETAKCAGHDCELTLAYDFPSEYSDYKKFKFYCDICDQVIVHHYWVYYCGPCRHFVHLGCMKTHETQANSSDNEDECNDGVLELPASDICQEIIGRFLLEEEENTSSEDGHEIILQPVQQIKHFGHEQHPLILCHERPNEVEEDEEIWCNCYIEPISSAVDYYYYSCAECSYFLHLSCAKLPKQLPVYCSCHARPLTLGCHQKFYHTFECKICFNISNGFFFKCDRCEDYYIDVKCAAMPIVIKHRSHKHHLTAHPPFPDDTRSCNACGQITFSKLDYSWLPYQMIGDFHCWDFKFSLHYRCAMLPGMIRHSFDPHSLRLRFPPYKDHPQEFICDLCEKDMHPKRWLYHCSECDLTSFHTTCVPRFETFPNIKYSSDVFQLSYKNIMFGGIIETSSHPHPLKSVQKPTFKKGCDNCGTIFSHGN